MRKIEAAHDEPILFPPQQDVMDYGFLETGFNCFLNMATGSGKTYLAEQAIRSCLERGFKAIYLTPLKALAEQTLSHWKKEFQPYQVGMFTGDTKTSKRTSTSYEKTNVYIMTPERLDACLRNWRSHWAWIPNIDLVIVDEFHLLADRQRGPRLEGSITRLMRINPFTRFLGLSATMPNASELSDWLQGVHYSSNWRQVPLDKKFIRYKNNQEKTPILLSEVNRCTSRGGKSLVFVNSRSRAQQVAQTLVDSGLRAKYHHAGLDSETRRKVEESFRNGDTEVLVATSTLEMGLNLPTRQVILFDCYAFNGEEFTMLPVWSYIQRAGRAGRPSLDSSGEVVLLLPRWAGSTRPYEEEQCEQVQSSLGRKKAMIEQLLVELSSGYAYTRDHLIKGFLPLTFFYHQHPSANIQGILNEMILTDLISIKEGGTEDHSDTILKPTPLGRLAVKLMLSPSTVRIIRDTHNRVHDLKYFDLLLIAAWCEDCNPVLPVNYEDLHLLCEKTRAFPSQLMDLSLDQLSKLSPECPATLRLLAGIKMATICYLLTAGVDKCTLEEQFDVYSADTASLQDSIVRILDSMAAIIPVITEKREGKEATAKLLVEMITLLSHMVAYELPPAIARFTRIPGVGGKKAKILMNYGFLSVSDILCSSNYELMRLPGIGGKMAEAIIQGAKNLSQETYPAELCNKKSTELHIEFKTTNIDLYRLRRSMELTVHQQEEDKYAVTGGREDHIVMNIAGVFICDCLDHAKRQQDCKHIIAVRKFLNETETLLMINRIKENKRHSLREALPTLWFGLSGQSFLKERTL